ncbi:hypothetical protein CMO89_04110 [Candidatus Woesearchaeota archaeon]|nr:hypothetical protein [Candidatus Woesearchaeota archaeon]|tara:strand:+ start:15794 stop:16330 length:537 start_codon:yes stop_codon:yes gene_type:complete
MYKKRKKRTELGRNIESYPSKNAESQQILDVFIDHLQEEHKYSLGKVNKLFLAERDNIQVPIHIFAGKLSTLEAVVKYLKERLGLRYREISRLLGRDERTIWTTYQKAIKKQKKTFSAKKAEINIPLKIFRNRRLSPLESLVFFLLYSLNLKNHQVCVLLNKKPSTISTINSRALKKK